MKETIKISVLMAIYNTDFLLIKRAIDSVLAQDVQDFELIIIDDGSYTDTCNQVLAYARQHQDKIVYIRHANRGQAKSINRGILNSIGEYITILDGDDEYKPNHLRACLEEMNYADLIASTTETIVDTDEDYYVPDRKNHSELVHVDDCILFATLFGRRAVFTGADFQGQYAADADFYEKVSQHHRTKKVDLRTYVYYRNIPTSTCSTIKRQQQVAEFA